MANRFHIPVYSDLAPKRRQQVNMALGGLAAVAVVLVVSGFVGGPAKVSSVKNAELPKAKSLTSVAGEQLDPRDRWVGGAAKDVTRMGEDVKALGSEMRQRAELQDRTNKELLAKLEKLTGERVDRMSNDAKDSRNGPRQSPVAPNQAASASDGHAANPVGDADGQARQGSPTSLTGQPRASRLPKAGAGSGVYPPGRPNDPAGGATEAGMAMAAAPVGLIRVSDRSAASPSEGGGGSTTATNAGSVGTGPATGSAAAPMRRVDSFLPVSYTRATLLGGVAAPTGGQSQNNPVPVLLRLVDAAVLPNQFRGEVRDCLVVAEGFGDLSSERAYIRTTLLSCVLKDGTVVEVPIKGSIFGEDGMNGVRGTVVTKQGQILTNALLSGIASSIGQGVAQSTQQVNTTALGSTSTNPTDTRGILKQGLGDGVGKALDRLSQYYINLAEKTFPVIEIQPGRTVDVVITQGVQLDLTTVAGKAVYPKTRAPGAPSPSLLKTVADEDTEE